MLSARLILRCFHTSLVAQARHRRIVDDPGLKRRMQVFDEDDEYKREIHEDEDISSLESDFHNADLMYNEHKRELFKKKQFQDNKITIKKFFSGLKPPNMLTWAERLQIINLHKKDPEEWSLDALAESFPATRATISKILNTKWKPENINKMKRKDETVHENWQLLAENKLDAEPELLEHLKKFLPRREEFLKSIENNEIELLERPEPKKIWNNGQMSRILESYDNSLRILDEKQKLNQKLVENKDERQILTEQIRFQTSELDEDVETFKLGPVSRFSKLTTLSEFKRNLESTDQDNLVESGKPDYDHVNISNTHSSERSLLVQKNNSGSKGTENTLEKVIDRTHINERLANLAGYSLQGKVITKREKKVIHHTNSSRPENIETVSMTDKMLQTPRDDPDKFLSHYSNETKNSRFSDLAECDVNINHSVASERINESSSQSGEEEFTETHYKIKENVKESTLVETRNEEKVPSFQYIRPDREELVNRKQEKETQNKGLAKMMEELEANSYMTEPIKTESEEITKTYDFPSEQEKTDFEKEEKSISQTFFWDSNENKEIVQEPNIDNLEVNKLKSVSVTHQVEYAERIKIPREKRGSGLTFRVKDCYYDDDGEFLYRVPGMTKTEEKETVG